jgi:hypothetical protein
MNLNTDGAVVPSAWATSHGALRMDQTHAMPEQEIDPRKVRIGLAIVVVSVVIAVALIAVVDSTLVRAIMAGVVALGIVRTYMLFRSIRREHAGG